MSSGFMTLFEFNLGAKYLYTQYFKDVIWVHNYGKFVRNIFRWKASFSKISPGQFLTLQAC